CEAAFPSENLTYEHCNKSHITSGKQSCQWCNCDTFVVHKGQLKDHLITHFSSKLRPIRCPSCSKHLRSRQELHRHIKTHSSSSTPKRDNNPSSLNTLQPNFTGGAETDNDSSPSTTLQFNLLSPTDMAPRSISTSSHLSDVIQNESLSINTQDVSESPPLLQSPTSVLPQQFQRESTSLPPYQRRLEVLADALCPPFTFNSFSVGNTIKFLWLIADSISNDYQISIPEQFQLNIARIYKMDGLTGRMPDSLSTTILNFIVKSATIRSVDINSYLRKTVPNMIAPILIDSTKQFKNGIEAEIGEMYQESCTINNAPTSFSPSSSKFPYVRLLRKIAKILKAVIEDELTNEDKISFYEPSSESQLFKSDLDCSAWAILLRFKFSYTLENEECEKFRKTVYEIIFEKFKLEIDSLSREFLQENAGKFWQKLCCLGLL
ncbi:hypothetical protein HDU92_009041, partial [Lobulomyces angularis]